MEHGEFEPPHLITNTENTPFNPHVEVAVLMTQKGYGISVTPDAVTTQGHSLPNSLAINGSGDAADLYQHIIDTPKITDLEDIILENGLLPPQGLETRLTRNGWDAVMTTRLMSLYYQREAELLQKALNNPSQSHQSPAVLKEKLRVAQKKSQNALKNPSTQDPLPAIDEKEFQDIIRGIVEPLIPPKKPSL